MQIVAILCRSAWVFCVVFTIAVVDPAIAGADKTMSPADRLFGETVITEAKRVLPSLSGLSPDEIADLSDSKDVLTEIFRRLSPAYGKPLGELFSDSYQDKYGDPQQFYGNHFSSEALISYRIHQFQLGTKGNREVRFWVSIREALEGTYYYTRHMAVLKNNNGLWKLYSFKTYR